jgi:hypothetical protein
MDALSFFFGPNDPLSLSEAQTPGDRREFSLNTSREARRESGPVLRDRASGGK